MKFATENDGTTQGRLLIVCKNNTWVARADDIAKSLYQALNHWDSVHRALEERAEQLNNGHLIEVRRLADVEVLAPLPKAPQWLDGSVFPSHGALMQKAFHLDPIEEADKYPLVYQGDSDNFCSHNAPIIIPDESYGTDFEGEFGVITGPVPLGASASESLDAIRLIVLLNDISYRTLAPREMKTGFGFVQAKGATAFAPIAVTPDELGESWAKGKVKLALNVMRNGEWFGHPHGEEMQFGFHDIIAHVTKTRALSAGSVIGSGTVSNKSLDVGQACIAELRAKELVSQGKPSTPFLSNNEHVMLKALDKKGRCVFGEINQIAQLGA